MLSVKRKIIVKISKQRIAKGSDGLMDKVSVSHYREHGFDPTRVTTKIPQMTPVLVGSRKWTRE